MSKISMSISGDAELLAKFRDASSDIKRKVGVIIKAIAFDVQYDAVESIQRGEPSGRIYKRGKGYHRASAPGESPASDTGQLAGSIDVKKIGDLEYQIGTHLKYGLHLEYGTQKMAERPWLRPAVDKNREEFFRRLREVLS